MDGAISQADLQSFNRTIAATVAASKKSMTGAMIQASVFAAQSAAAATPKAKKNRVSKRITSKRIRGSKTRAKREQPWWAVGSVDIWKRGVMKKTFFLKERNFQRARATPRVGLGKAVWKATAAKRAALGLNQSIVNRFSMTDKQTIDGMLTSITMTNALDYIGKVAPQSAAIGVKKADNRMQGIINRKLARDIEQAFQRRHG